MVGFLWFPPMPARMRVQHESMGFGLLKPAGHHVIIPPNPPPPPPTCQPSPNPRPPGPTRRPGGASLRSTTGTGAPRRRSTARRSCSASWRRSCAWRRATAPPPRSATRRERGGREGCVRRTQGQRGLGFFGRSAGSPGRFHVKDTGGEKHGGCMNRADEGGMTIGWKQTQKMR